MDYSYTTVLPDSFTKSLYIGGKNTTALPTKVDTAVLYRQGGNNTTNFHPGHQLLCRPSYMDGNATTAHNTSPT